MMDTIRTEPMELTDAELDAVAAGVDNFAQNNGVVVQVDNLDVDVNVASRQIDAAP